MIQNKCGAQDCKTCMEYVGNWCDFWRTKVTPDKWCEQWWGKSKRREKTCMNVSIASAGQ